MDNFLKMDVFFVVTTVVVLIIGGLVAYICYRVGRILRHIEHVSEQVALEADAIRGDLADLRGDLRKGKSKLQSFLTLFGKVHKRSRKERPSTEA